MEKIHLLIQLTRLDKPIGILLLFWPCLWGLTLGYYLTGEQNLYLEYVILFFIGSILMRSAGCIVNDIIDRNFDKKVKRTRNRPIASGKISIYEGLLYVFILCLVALIILLKFNLLTIILGMFSMIFAFSYPFMKRITYWPQLFLGLTFNWGIIMGWTAMTNSLSVEPFILYLSAIFWTLGYDTIYGLQDIVDDEIIGVKSTSIKFRKNVKFFVGTCYFLCVIVASVFLMFLKGNNYFLIFFTLFIITLIYQMKKFNPKKPKTCLESFKLNNLSGMLMFLNIFSFTIYEI